LENKKQVYICSPKTEVEGKFKEREFSSVGSEHLPYKQRVTGSNPVTPTKTESRKEICGFFVFKANRITIAKACLSVV
jgi:hypothetical protein